MWGQGLQGLKVTNLLGFLWPSEAPKCANETKVIKSLRSSDLHIPTCVGQVSRRRNAFQDGETSLRRIAKGNTRSHERIGRTTSPCALPSPKKPTKRKTKKGCSHNFMHDRTFCSHKTGAKTAADGDNICGRRYVADVGSFLREGEQYIQWMKVHKPEVGRVCCCCTSAG